MHTTEKDLHMARVSPSYTRINIYIVSQHYLTDSLPAAPWTSYQIRKLPVAHAPGMPGTFSPPPTSKQTASYRSRHASRHVRHARAVMHVGIANPWWWGKRPRHSRRMRNPQFCLSGKRPIVKYSSECMLSGFPYFYSLVGLIVINWSLK